MQALSVRIPRLAALAVAMTSGAFVGIAVAQPVFRIAVMPDTQFYSANTTGTNGPFFAAQTQWIVDNAASRNIVFSTHLGDVVNTAGPVGAPSGEWLIAVPAMEILKNSTVPHSVLPGNHEWTNSGGSGSIEHYRVRFGDTSNYFAGKSWFLGFDPRGVNSAQRFTTPLGDFLHISMEWNAAAPAVSSDRPSATTSAIGWAQGIINANPNIPTIISTHNNVNTGGVRDAQGQQLFNQLVAPNNQVFLVLNGHYSGSITERLLSSTNNFGRPVYEMLTDYQARNRGGDGWMRLLEFDAPANQVRARTYTPLSDAVNGSPAGAEYNNVGRVEIDADSEFSLSVNFATRFVPVPPTPPTPPGPEAGTPMVLKRGVNGYAGTVDTEIRRNQAATNLSAQGYMHIDTDEGGTALQWPVHGLIRFDDLFGPGPNQVPGDKSVLGAKLRLYVHASRAFSDGSGFDVHRMLVNWSNTTTWNSAELSTRGTGIGVSPTAGLPTGFDTRWYEPGSNGFEALASADAVAGANTTSVNIPQGTWLELDVTRSLRAFQDGAPNYGWLLQALPNTTNATRVESAESELAGGFYPELVITSTRDAVQTRVFTQGIDTTIDQSSPTTANGASGSLVIDGGSDNASPASADQAALIRFTNIFGSAADQIPQGARIASATLKLNANINVANYDGSGFSAHRMLSDWSDASTWDSLAGGVTPDNVELALTPDDVGGYQRSASPWDITYLQAGRYQIDVTDSLRRWSAGNGNLDNRGWALLPLVNGTNAVIFESFEAGLPSTLRPELVVRFNIPCAPDFNGNGLGVDDIFDFLAAWFAGDIRADFNGNGLSVNDIFDFLAAWFAGC
jgi:Calcineurin-like phosphoesterase